MAESSILRSVTGCWIWLGIWIYYRPFFLLPTFLNIDGTTNLHTNVSLTTWIPQECLSCPFDVLVNLGQIFALFLVLLMFTLNIICLLWVLPYDISLRKIKMGLYLWKSLQNISFQQCQWSRCSSEIFVYKLFWQRQFQFLLFYIGKICSKSVMRSNNRIFYTLFYFIANFN